MPAKDGFQLQQSDIELLQYAHQLRIATIDHLATLSGRSVRALWGRLHKLKQRRYLASVARFMQKQVYAIGSAGLPLLVEEGYSSDDLKEKRLRHRELTEIGIRHSLFIADIHAHLLLLTKAGSITLPHWEEGRTLWDTVPGRGTDDAIPVRPDAYFVLKHAGRPEGKNIFHVFLEADRSTMSHERMERKITGYVRYYDRRLHARKYPGMHSFLIATVTETRARAEELRKDLLPLIPRSAARDAYLFIPIEQLSLEVLLPKATAAAVN
jgi:hypothetical protein